jgi:hypothetical protein
MGEAELHIISHRLVIRSVFFLYGDAATKELSCKIADDINNHWNEPKANIKIAHEHFDVEFDIEAFYAPDLDPEKVWYNDNPTLNFFRIEEFAEGNISYVDEFGSNTGYLKLDDIVRTSTTAAHEYGHTLGLRHPSHCDIRGQGIPGIMYPRGTLCDAGFQYDPQAAPGQPGATLNPCNRKVRLCDIEDLKLHRLIFIDGKAIVGDFSSMYHAKEIPATK